ncbi:MAG: methionyl-tRNA formyltransferase, partial [Acidobacteria bacterium]|nr:methionyl-tRNA formyltransferase [Acidobacteriota bacterium]
PRLGCINVHSSILPKYRGAAPINWAIVQGETETGVTIMQMDVGMDTGDILRQDTTAIGATETAEQLTPRLAELGASLLIETLAGIERSKITPQKQNEAEATYAPMLKREDGLVDWTLSATQLYNRLRGFTPFPGCYTLLHEQRLEIVAATAEAHTGDAAPGTIVEIAKDSFAVACGHGSQLRLTQVQPAGKKVMAVHDFLNGAKLQVGTKLG